MAGRFDRFEAARLNAAFTEVTGQRPVSMGDYEPKTPDDFDFEIKNYANVGFESEEEYQDYLENSTNQGPAMLTDLPTSSTNAGRPRTVAAGYQPYVGTKRGAASYADQKGKMTVMFRDGTLYNYYDVTPGEWQNFKNSISKGAPWLNKGFDSPNAKQRVDGLFVGKPQGPADLSQVSESVQRSIQKTARNAQVQFSTKRSVTIKAPELRGPTTYKSPQGYVSKSGAARARKSLGTNPSKGGKNPYKP
jgi:hypothetical protein